MDFVPYVLYFHSRQNHWIKMLVEGWFKIMGLKFKLKIIINNAEAFCFDYVKRNNTVMIIIQKAIAVVIMLLSGTHVV